MDDRMSRLSEVARIAVALEQQTGCPAQLMIAQWAVESRWGVAPVGHANYFGIKMAERHKACCTVSTHEIVNGQRVEQEAQFADYDSLAESCRDYAWLITEGAPYRAAWQAYQTSRALNALVDGVAKTYSTNPAYAALVRQIAGQANVAQAIAAARQEAGHVATA